MYILKGFMVMQSLSNNDPGMIAQIGELSTYSKTFTKELGHYSRDEYPAVDMMSFYSHREGVGDIKVPVVYQDTLLEMSQWLYTNAVGGLFDVSKSNFLSLFLSEWAAFVESVDAGDMTASLDEVSWLPQYLKFKLRGPGEENYVKIWFTDDAFRRQYDEYEIEVVPPIENLDDLTDTPINVKAKLDALDDSERMIRIEEAKDGHPSTRVRIDMYDWMNPLAPETVLSTSWGIVIYGPAGNNIDNIRNALVKYIIANSSYTREEWEDYLPDLFKATEYILTPLWTNYSIPNETLMAGLYSPTVPVQEILEIAKSTATRYDATHVESVLSTSVSMYRSLSFLAVGGPDNRDGIMTYQERFKDYIVIPTTSSEFSRMSPSTQEWVVLLSQMLKVAETMTEFTDVPLRMTRLIRDGIMYVVASFEDVQYLVVSRQSYYDLFGGGPDEPTDGDDDLEGGTPSGPAPLILTIDTTKQMPDTDPGP